MDCEMENEYNALCDINATHYYLPTDMEEDNPLDLENIKESSNTWGHIAKYMGTHCQIHGDTYPNTWGQLQTQKIYVQHIWGQIANTKQNLWNIIDYHAWHESRSTLHLRQ